MSRKSLAITAKAAISAFLVWFLLERVELANVLERARALHAGTAVLCLLALVFQIALITVRWWLVARAIDTPLKLLPALRILVIGMFFNQTLPSSVGGDAVRVWLVTREGAPLGKAVNLVLCDRILGVVVLIAVIGLTLPAIYARIPEEATGSALAALVAITAMGLLVFLLMGQRAASLLRRWKPTRPFGDLAVDVRQLFARPAYLSMLAALSAGIHVVTVAVVALLASGLYLPVSFLEALIIVPTVILLTTLPISVAGWGVREGAMVAGFGAIGVAADGALALSVLFGLAQVLVALPGGIVWLAGRRRINPPPDIDAVSG